MKQALSIVGMTLLTACGGRAHPQSPPPTRLPSVPAIALSLTPLSGQKIGVLPTTLVVTDTVLASDSFFNSRSRVLAWTDSLIGVALTERGREVNWVLPGELRRVAHRAPSMNLDPDRMGQSVMGSPRAEFMPEPLRANARNLVALIDGRYLLIPAAVAFVRMPDGNIRAELSVVLTDARNGRVNWRSLVKAIAATPGAALNAALAYMLPLPMNN